LLIFPVNWIFSKSFFIFDSFFLQSCRMFLCKLFQVKLLSIIFALIFELVFLVISCKIEEGITEWKDGFRSPFLQSSLLIVPRMIWKDCRWKDDIHVNLEHAVLRLAARSQYRNTILCRYNGGKYLFVN